MKNLLVSLLVITVLAIAFSPVISSQLESQFNKVRQLPPYKVSTEAKRVHEKLLIADLHADPLLWGRDLNKRSSMGHFDFPRMQEGNLSLQVFGLVTKVPKGQNFQSNKGDSDKLTQLAMLQHWPIKTWDNLTERALYQANQLLEYTKNDSDFMLIKNRSDLSSWLSSNKPIKAGMLAIEGAHALGVSLENFETLYSAGIRMIGMAHFFDNHFSGSAHGFKKGGLSSDGKTLVKLAQKRGVLIDLAHASPQAIDDIILLSSKPLVVSHTGVKGTCSSPRNLSDKHIKAVADSGGVVAVAIFKEATCGTNIKSMVDAIDYVVKLVGVDFVAFGLDLDGAVTSPIDVTGMPLITEELLKRGYSQSEIAKISGMNFIRVLKNTLN